MNADTESNSIVYCGRCRNWLRADEVEFLNIEEGPSGEDIMTFTCPDCEHEEKSRVLVRPAE